MLYNTIISKPFIFFYIMYNHMTMTVTCDGYVTVCDIMLTPHCYDLKLKGLSNKTTLVLSNTRELNRVPSTK